MNSSVVNVLTPNGRRQNVKVQPDTTILKVLEDVCQKHGFNSNEYDLKHHKRIMDLSTMYRFSGLPNNAQLEMVEAQKKRTDTEVSLLVQLSDGTRLEQTFKPTCTIADIVQQLCPEKSDAYDLVAVYMRTEVPSDKMAATTLKELGLISGRAIIRLIHRDPDAAKIQANVALNLPQSVKPTEESKSDTSTVDNKKAKKEAPLSTNAILNTIKSEKGKASEPENNEEENMDVDPATELPVPQDLSKHAESHGSAIKEEATVPEEKDEDDDDDDVGEIHILGERSAVVFTLDSMKKINLDSLPDSFFDLNVHDIRSILRDLRSHVQGTSSQPLLTAQLRELEEDKDRLNKLNRYQKTIIRIQFSDRYVLQGTFAPLDTIETVMNFVRPYLVQPDMDFYLYTTPPKTILTEEMRLFETKCVPSAILHFGTDTKLAPYLRNDVLAKVSSGKASLKQALLDRGLEDAEINLGSKEDTGTSSTSQSNVNGQANSKEFKMSTTASTQEKLPKWFKPIGK